MSEHVATSSAPSERTIAARRSDRDIWISRSHVRAASAGGVLLLVCSFALGYSVGGQAANETSGARPGLLAAVPGEELVDLLARVETAADRRGEVERLTFPDSLRGVEAAEVIQEAVVNGDVERPVEQKPAAASESSYAVVVARLSDTEKAQELGWRLQELGLSPVNTREHEGVFEVKYGRYASVDAAEATLSMLEPLSLSSEPVVTAVQSD